MLYFLLSSSLLLCLMFFHQPLNQSLIWPRSFRSLAISSSIHLFQYGSVNYFLLAIIATLSHTNLAPALKRFFSSSKFCTVILKIISMTSETVLLTFKASIPRSEYIASLLFSYIILLFLWVSSFWCNSSVSSIPPSAAWWFCYNPISMTIVTSKPSTGSFSINTSTGFREVVTFLLYFNFWQHFSL